LHLWWLFTWLKKKFEFLSPKFNYCNRDFFLRKLSSASASYAYPLTKIGLALCISKSKGFLCIKHWNSSIALLATNTLSVILAKYLLLKSLDTCLIYFKLLHKINIGVLVTSLPQALAIKGRKIGWSSWKSKNLNETFLLGKLAIFINIREWSEIPKGRKQVSKPENTQLQLTLTRTLSNFFKIGLTLLISGKPRTYESKIFQIRLNHIIIKIILPP